MFEFMNILYQVRKIYVRCSHFYWLCSVHPLLSRMFSAYGFHVNCFNLSTQLFKLIAWGSMNCSVSGHFDGTNWKWLMSRFWLKLLKNFWNYSLRWHPTPIEQFECSLLSASLELAKRSVERHSRKWFLSQCELAECRYYFVQVVYNATSADTHRSDNSSNKFWILVWFVLHAMNSC